MSDGGEPIIERTVKPRKPHRTELPIISVGPHEFYSELTGEVLSRRLLADVLYTHPAAFIVCQNPEALLSELHPIFKDDPKWQFRVTPMQRERIHYDGKRTGYTEMLVNFFGWRRQNGHRKTRYFYPLCPSQFCRQYIHEIYGGDDPYHERLYRWGLAVRTFCQRFDLKPSPTGGGIAAQLLRHPNFYSEPRRKVPTATNEKARQHLPGNYYEIGIERTKMARLKGLPYEPIRAAWYIDQFDAHHSAACRVPVPHADHLRAHGRFRSLDASPWVRSGAAGWDSVRDSFGLLHVSLEIPSTLVGRKFLPPALRKPGIQAVYCYTSELAEFERLGARILWVSAAWTSTESDPGLRKYAEWARGEVAAAKGESRWLKPTLLAAYGILAARPRQLEFLFYRADKGEPTELILGPELIHAMKLQTKKPIQSPIANVIQRGMIEAETRNRSLRLARELHGYGLQVLAIYADAVIVRDNGKPLPLCTGEFPWRVKDRLTELQFLNETAFRSREKSRLPGIARKDRAKKGVPNGYVRQGTNPDKPGLVAR